MNNYKKGDIVVAQWSYTMTYPEYYIVTRVTPKKVGLTRIDDHMVRSTDGGYNQQGYVAPVLPVTEKGYGLKDKLCNVNEEGEIVIKDGYSTLWATLWDGKPKWANYCD
jgi:hypothetical protein